MRTLTARSDLRSLAPDNDPERAEFCRGEWHLTIFRDAALLSRPHANARLPRQPAPAEAGGLLRPGLDRKRVGPRLPRVRTGMRLGGYWLRLATPFALIVAGVGAGAGQRNDPPVLFAPARTPLLATGGPRALPAPPPGAPLPANRAVA